jgi:two-component sensor histidine kinase
MSTPRPTPETQAAIIASNGQWSYVLRETCERFERELNEARDQLQAMREAIREVYNSFADEDSAWLLDDLQTAALTKLQPFIKP